MPYFRCDQKVRYEAPAFWSLGVKILLLEKPYFHTYSLFFVLGKTALDDLEQGLRHLLTEIPKCLHLIFCLFTLRLEERNLKINRANRYFSTLVQ